MKRILATGGAGFIGSHAVKRLLDEGCEVLNVDKLTYAGSLENLGSHINSPNHHFEKVDICDAEKIAKLFSSFKPDAVLHMAAESHVDRSIDGPAVFIQTNIVGTHVMLKSAHDYVHASNKDFRFLHLSTDEVFGALGKTGFFNEETPYQPNSPYAASKASSDLLARSYWKTYRLPVSIVNCSNNYGPNQYPEKLIPLTILNAMEQKPLPVYGNGENVRDWLFVQDHVDALWCVLNATQAGENFCVGGGYEVRNIDIVKMICSILNKKKPTANPYEGLITYVTDRPGHDFRYATDCTKIKNTLGWAPKTDFKTGLEATIDWYLHEQKRLNELPARHRQGKTS